MREGVFLTLVETGVCHYSLRPLFMAVPVRREGEARGPGILSPATDGNRPRQSPVCAAKGRRAARGSKISSLQGQQRFRRTDGLPGPISRVC